MCNVPVPPDSVTVPQIEHKVGAKQNTVLTQGEET